MSSSDMSTVQNIFPCPGGWWDLDEEVDLEWGMRLIYEGGGALSAGAYGVIFPCKLKLGRQDGCRVINAVVKCENRNCNDKDGYEIHKVRKIPHHGNLVKFYDGKVLELGESAHFGALMVFERMDCNLKQLVFEDRDFAETCTNGDLVNILEQIIQGLMHLNENRYIHLDLKPKNVLVAKNPGGKILIKIADFGESKKVKDEGHSVTATCRGTQGYMAPEVKWALQPQNTKSKITEHVDVYSSGMLMCALFNKKDPPFTSKQDYLCGRDILVGDVVPYKVFCGAPLEFCDLIEQCLQFKVSNIEDSRKHGRPSLGETLQALRKMKECKWMTQTLQTKNICHSKESMNTQDENLSRALIKEAGDGNIRAVRNLLKTGADVNSVYKNAMNALHHACRRGHTEVAKMLLESGADLNLVDNNGWTALHQACFEGHTEVAKVLLKSGADVNSVDNNGVSALHQACSGGHTEVTKVLLKSGADTSLVYNYHLSALHKSCFQSHTGAGVNWSCKRGLHAFRPACSRGHTDVAKLMWQSDKIGQRALRKARSEGYTEGPIMSVESGAAANLVDKNSVSAPRPARSRSLKETIKFVQKIDKIAQSALHKARSES